MLPQFHLLLAYSLSDLAFLQCPLPPFVFIQLLFPPPPLTQPNSLSFSLCCSCQNPPAPSISPSPLAFSREVIHGIALPQAYSSTKIPWEHGGMAGVSRAGRAAARSHTQAAGKGPGWKERAVFQLLVYPQLWFTLICRALLCRFWELCSS